MSSNNPAAVPPAVLSDSQWNQINQAISPLNPQQLTWLSGYLAGLAQTPIQQVVAAPTSEAATSASLTILYGSQTGNAKGVASGYKALAEAAGYAVTLSNMADYKAKQIKNETHLLIVVSTHGEGEPPDDAMALHEFLASKKAPKLADLKYAVVGLGDSSYEFFCQTAKDFDQRLAALGAVAIKPRLDCDVDYDSATEAFGEALIADLKDALSAPSSQVVAMPSGPVGLSVASQTYTKKHPFTATLSEAQKITGRDSSKDIRHIEISLEGSGIQYRPGDALGIWFKNDPHMVDDLLTLLAIDAQETVRLGDDELTVKEALVERLELTQSYPTFVTAYQATVQSDDLAALLADKGALREYLQTRQIIDIVREHTAEGVSAQQLVDSLRGITPRLYSIASSQSEVEDEVHLTVALVEYEAHGHTHQGGASGYLAKRLEEGAEVQVFVEHNDNFRLPENPDTPVIMIGPGTGVAPFRAFMQEREMQDAEGKNWLFFGNPHFTQDFLYQTEWQRFVKEGVLDKITLAFSRDQEQKIYVQHRLLEHGADVYQWLLDGAHIYVCGDATHMAKDVHDALVQIVEQHGNLDREAAEAYVTELRKAKRYQKDVY
ncbi:assimilatory sulfite reductase (NADPH) flavoprotein subunit [Aestuariibacter halophilus]|uniref:Sulfite reductase [NADPH] flavoprotein alpha-component n=1 Tax=Fluctibacter halophilus TaxID=226011 RepID=A0ABS8GGD3_9ALTE|nr:assimilatory sulfite reductase (NADPH) flavoprotein subunit [Aestuariibacter halophilus]MCC2618241.1 assimilatory sulfite reductase (NADPH) flavoprotein subunit [Aestuariibacter halophilus]